MPTVVLRRRDGTEVRRVVVDQTWFVPPRICEDRTDPDEPVYYLRVSVDAVNSPVEFVEDNTDLLILPEVKP